MVDIICLQKIINDPASGASFPIYCGFTTAADLATVASAPSFTRQTPHHEIAQNVSTTPVARWQRPVDPDRVSGIASTFSDPSKLMPNPVLVAQNLSDVISRPTVTPLSVNGAPTGTFNIHIQTPTAGSAKPLWILDGQHRIGGLAASALATGPLPVVILLPALSNSYSGGQLAEIFAQVTTAAEDLKPEHKEWLTAAFSLERYSPAKSGALDRKLAFDAVVELCRHSTLTGGGSNSFHNAVRFNPYLAASASGGGFGSAVEDLVSLLKSYYFDQQLGPGIGRLTARALADQLSHAYDALLALVRQPQTESVFFGDKPYGEKIMQDAFLVGALAYLASHGPPGATQQATSWTALLKAVQMDQTDWNFHAWVGRLGGKAQEDSRKVAFAVMRDILSAGVLPPAAIQGGSQPTIVDVLRGATAGVTFQISRLTPQRRASSRAARRIVVASSGTTSLNLQAGERHIRVVATTPNIAAVELEVGAAAAGSITARQRALWTMQPAPFVLVVRSRLYGDAEHVVRVNVS